MFVWGVMSLAALGTLVWRHPLADVAAKAAAPIGACFTFLALVTGSLWGRPMWGTYWEWDARLTSVLILFLMYLGLIALWRAVEDPSRAGAGCGGIDAGRRDQPADHQIFGGLVEYAASARFGAADGRPRARPRVFDSAVGHGGRVFAVVSHAASGGDAQRDSAAAGSRLAADAGQPRFGVNVMSLGPYAPFIVASYLLVTAVVLILIAWIAIDYRRQNQRLRELEASGVVRRSGSRRGGPEMSEPSSVRNSAAKVLADGAAAGCLRRAGRVVLVSAGHRRSLENPFRPDRPAGAADRAAAARRVSRPRVPPVPGLDPAVFKGKVSIVNVWASWCVPCHDEAPLLIALGRDKRLQLVGINYKDAPDNARRFLGRYGNPFGIVGVDGNGRAAIEWGVYGVPETFIVGREGTIVYKMVGPMTPENIDTVLKVEIEKALKAGS